MSAVEGVEPEIETEQGEEVPLVESTQAIEPPVESPEEETDAEQGTEELEWVPVLKADKILSMMSLLSDCASKLDRILRDGGFEIEALRKMQADLEGGAEGWRLDLEIKMSVRRKN